MIPTPIKTEILKRIQQAETEHNVRVLYAIESGSRAWGFASVNSDYDVRFIYAHPQDWYLSINVENHRDVIEYPIVDEIDINGWDIRKALRLLRKSNPSIVEWLHSPLVYIDDGHFATQTRALLATTYSINRGIYHYYSMAKTTYRTHLCDENVLLKKYFYALRPLFAVHWLERYQQVPPVEFAQLRQVLHENTALNTAIDELLARKKASIEKEFIPTVPVLNAYIEAELNRLSDYKAQAATPQSDLNDLNKLFQHCIDF